MQINSPLATSDKVKRSILTGATVVELCDVARDRGMPTLIRDRISRILQGLTDYSQMQAVTTR